VALGVCERIYITLTHDIEGVPLSSCTQKNFGAIGHAYLFFFFFPVLYLAFILTEDMHFSCTHCLLSIHILSLSVPTREPKKVK